MLLILVSLVIGVGLYTYVNDQPKKNAKEKFCKIECK
jgi:hypothetical protein